MPAIDTMQMQIACNFSCLHCCCNAQRNRRRGSRTKAFKPQQVKSVTTGTCHDQKLLFTAKASPFANF